MRAAASCVAAMAELLTSDLCGWPTERVVCLVDVASPSLLARQIISAVRDTQDTVLVYYVGHGLRTYDGQLALAVSDTDADSEFLPHTAMLYEAIAKILRGSPAATKLVILDCCHAELGTRANYVFQSSDDIAEAYPVDGLYFIGASRINQKARAPIGGELTYFTRAFMDIVREGIPGAPALLSLGQIFVALRGRLVRGNLPIPVESGNRGAYQYPFARNVAARVGPNAHDVPPAGIDISEAAQQSHEVIRTDRVRAARVLNDAERSAQSITIAGAKASVLASLASELAATHPERAGRLIADAERVARAISGEGSEYLDEFWKASALVNIAGPLAALDADRGERLAQSITNDSSKASALANVAEALAATDPDRAVRVAQSITDDNSKAVALSDVAEALAATDPNRAEQVAQSITDEVLKAWTLASLAEALAALIPDRAARLSADAELVAQRVIDESRKASTPRDELDFTDPDYASRLSQSFSDEFKIARLTNVARLLAAVDPDRAERVAQSIAYENVKASALASVATALAALDPDRAARLLAEAERIARSITDENSKARALANVAKALAAIDPDRAERLAQSITDENSKASALSDVAKALAAMDPDRAERLAQSITDENSKARALANVAEALVAIDPDRAERLAQSMADGGWKVSVLVEIAKAWSKG